MSFGAGKYDELCTYVRAQAQAEAAIVLIIGGDKGEGFSCQASAAITTRLPSLLREIATQLESDATIKFLKELPP